ncbi:unnamed protein product, partial [Rotaria magnacalcarata]
MTHVPSILTTPRLIQNTYPKPDLPIKPVSAFTYRHGNLTVFDLAYGPNGWFLKS